MVSKATFSSKCRTVLSNYFTEQGTKSTIDVMEKLKLKGLGDSDKVSPDLVNLCTTTLVERVRMLKGEDMARKFLEEMKT